MGKLTKKFLYRIFCIMSLLAAVYLIVDLKISKALDVKMMIVFALLFIVTVWGIVDWKSNYEVIRKQEEELRLYKLYIAPLEELVKEIRAKQHEYDNHKNAILNMHLTVDNYEELVERQSAYLRGLEKEGDGQFMPLLRISDKVLAGFLYSKIVRAKDYIRTDVVVQSFTILSKASEHSIIEVVGTLVDNAYEACTKESNHVVMQLDSRHDRLIFEIKNKAARRSVQEIGKFFEKGYSSKGTDGKRGLGLYRAKALIQKHHGEITVGQEDVAGENYICFKIEI